MVDGKHIEKIEKSTTEPKQRKKFESVDKYFFIQLFLVTTLIMVGIVSWNSARGVINTIDQQNSATEEAARPANLEIVTIIDESCTDCGSVVSFLDYIKKQNVEIIKESNFDVTDGDAQTIISEYGVKQVPFFIVTGEISKSEELEQMWSSWGRVQGDTFILTTVVPPYLDLVTREVRGKVSITYITYDSCDDCYDVMKNKTILENSYGVYLASEITVDATSLEGKELVEKYAIKKVPTFIVSNEAAVYQGLLSVWSSIGSIEPDGAYVFREVNQFGTYYDLEKNEAVTPAVQADPGQSAQ